MSVAPHRPINDIRLFPTTTAIFADIIPSPLPETLSMLETFF
jgi:hypothetical protein